MRIHLYFATFVAALGELMFGFETGIINGSIFYMTEYFDLTDGIKGFVVSSALVGCIVEALGPGKPGDIFGMLKAMYLNTPRDSIIRKENMG